MFFDLETTGVNVAKDRIVEISILKVYPNGNKESKTWLVNPEMPIPPQTTAVHGITDEKVANEPTFKQLSKDIYSMIKGSDLAGFNSDRFDIPLLAEEMLRAEIDVDFKKHLTVDVQTIFHKMEKRNLSAAYKFYCGKDLDNAHSAEADTNATYEVLKSQIEKYDELENDVSKLSAFSTRRKSVDFAGLVIVDEDGDAAFNFGKHKGKKVVEVLEREPGYFSWLLNADFPRYTKKSTHSHSFRNHEQRMKIICIGRNYAAHIDELGNVRPNEPVIFIKPDTAIAQSNLPFFIPEFSNEVHHEVEVLVRINRIGKHIQAKFAHKYYDQIGLGIDFTARDVQQQLKSKGLPWEKAKAFDGSAFVGKWFDKSALGDLGKLSFSLYKNGELTQQADTSLMLWSIDEIIAYVSKYFTLKIGDIIFTGTPAGVSQVIKNDRLEGHLNGQKALSLIVK